MPTPPPSPAAAAPPRAAADAARGPHEYVPPAAPPALLPSEAMRRLLALRAHDKLADAAELTFAYHAKTFRAVLTPSGALSAPAPRPTDADPAAVSPDVRRVYASPTDFATAMATLAVAALPPRQRPRGKLSVNAWEECRVAGRSLAALRGEMLREKKPSAAADPPAATAATAATTTSAAAPKSPDAGKPDNAAEQPKPEATEKSAGDDGASEKAEEDMEKPEPGRKEDPPSKDVVQESAPEKSDEAPANPAKPKPMEDASKEGPPQAKSDPPGETHPTEDTKTDAIADEKPQDDSHAPPKPSDQPASPEPERLEDSADKPEPSSVEKSPADKSSVEKSSDEKPSVEKSSVEPLQSAEGEPSSEPSVDTKQRGEKRKPESPPKHETKRRKRSDGGSSPNESGTPSRRSQERSTRPRSEWYRNGRKHDIPSAAEMNTVGLDPDSIEAAAIAAQADKDEANSRARRTTRLAAGKIKQVDYKASAGVLGVRGFSPGNDEEEEEGNANANDSTAEPIRSSRRRAASQNHAVVAQRSSRRVARARASQDKDQSSNEDHEGSGGRSSPGGSGSDGRTGGDGPGRSRDMEVDNGGGVRTMVTRAEGRERIRTRGDTASRRARQNHADANDGDGYDQYHGMRSSTRESSVADGTETGENVDDGEDGIGDADEEEESNPDKRTDRFGWTYRDLTRIGDAVDMAESIAQEAINVELFQSEGWSCDEATNKKVAAYVERAVAAIMDVKKRVFPEKDCEVSVKELRAFIATNVWRLKHGGIRTAYPRNQRGYAARTEKEDVLKSQIERSRRKLQRDVEELRTKLDAEWGAGKKVEAELVYANIVLADKTRALLLEEARLERLDEDIHRYNVMESTSRSNLDKTKLLVSQLRGEKESPYDVPSLQSSTVPEPVTLKNGEPENEPASKPNGQSAENGTLEKDVEMKDVKPAKMSREEVEMQRLQTLIAAKETEAESYHRACEREHLKVRNLQDTKGRLESELYLSRHSSHGGSSGGGGGPPTSSSRKMSSEQRRNDSKNTGPSGHRNASNARGKTGNGKVSGGGSGAGGKVSGHKRPHSSHGKNGDASKSKRRATGPGGSKPPEANGSAELIS